MDGEHATLAKENVQKYKNRFMGKLFKDKKSAHEKQGENDNDSDSVDAFLHGPSDKLHMMPVPAGPLPTLSRIDTANARRWPTAAEIQNSRNTAGRAAGSKRTRKGLTVRFTDKAAEIIGEGGDEAAAPVSEIGVRRRAQLTSAHLQSRQAQAPPPEDGQEIGPGPSNSESFRPGLLRRTQTGYESLTEQKPPIEEAIRRPPEIVQDRSNQADSPNIDQHDPTSFAARVKAEMRAGEGKALVQASSHPPNNDQPHATSPESLEPEITPQLRELHLNTMRNSMISAGPTASDGIPVQLIPGRTSMESQRSTSMTDSPKPPSRPTTSQTQQSIPTPEGSNSLLRPPSSQAQQSNFPTETYIPLSRTSTSQTQNSISSFYPETPSSLSRTPTVQGDGDEALQEFSRRVEHLFTLFRLSAESVKPLLQCSLEEAVRAALWWFLKGRMNLEVTARDRPVTPQGQQVNSHVRQQSYSDLGKSLWITESIAQQVSDASNSGTLDAYMANVLESHQNIISGLRKMTMSMKRNGLLPREDAQLPQGLDHSIWVQYEGDRSLIASQRHNLMIPLLDAFPLGDSNRTFHYGRVFVEGILEEETAPQHYRCPVLVSLVRDTKEKELKAMVVSQDGSLKLCIQGDKTRGPTWGDVTWQSRSFSIRVGLPRGFALRLNCSEQDFRTIWGAYDYQNKIHSSLRPRRDEEITFEAIVKSFKYVDQNPESRFPKEVLPNCHLRVFEKTFVDKAGTGARTMHRGFRLAINTSPQTKTLRGIDQDLPPQLPIQFNFLRGDDGQPALDLKIDNSRSKYRMLLGFNDVSERARLHALLTGTALGDGEGVVVEAPLKAMSIAGPADKGKEWSCLKTLDWQGFRIYNEFDGDLQDTKAVLSDHLRVVLDFKTGKLTDRVNVGPGELKLRLDVKISKELKLLRQPQEDMTISVVESQVSRELPLEFAELLTEVAKSQSTRTYLFSTVQDLHLFQAALTGFIVLYDGMAASFNISRRRMVVPIYKKWDAATTRLQIVQREKVVQLVAFFENFSHGDCMNFTLKSTDVFETSSRSGKFTLRIVDAKFAMPKSREDADDTEFVCLDMPEYPGEHDDITIVFDSESERDKFTKALPAPTKGASRMASVRR